MDSAFDLENDSSYQRWRKQKLDQSISNNNDLTKLIVDIHDCNSPSPEEISTILQACHNNSFCLYRVDIAKQNNKQSIISLANHIGLSRLDANLCADDDKLTSITQTKHEGQHDYIPYSNKRLSWHTDGYYNTQDKQISSMLLHCNQPAKSGGETLFIDHELVYIYLRDKNPAFIKALMKHDAMTIPANVQDGKIIRPEQTGPVFSIHPNNQLHMRYSARKRNIEWQQSPSTLEAINFLEELFKSNIPHILKHTLQAGEGLICKNVLHRRTSFVDYEDSNKKRLLYRGRYFDTINTP